MTSTSNSLQAVILVGGRGTRLGELTQATPKPLLDVGGKPFLRYLIANLARHGFRRILLLAGYLGAQMQDLAADADSLGVTITCVVEPQPAGTGGALLYGRDHLDERFLLLNGDSLLDINYLDLAFGPQTMDPAIVGHVALRAVPDGSRYGCVELLDGRITAFAERPAGAGPGIINGGIYWLHRSILDRITRLPCSLESEVMPALAREGRLAGTLYDGYFIDIGIPVDLARAQTEIPHWACRPAAFLDRDGVLNTDVDYAHRPDQITWIPGVADAIRLLNESGYYVFVVTNQAGVAHGYYDEETVRALHGWMETELRHGGAHIDDWRYCPFHPHGVVEQYRGTHPWRKPGSGMLLDLMQCWPVRREGSFLIGDRSTDVDAATGAGVPGYLIATDDLPGQVRRLIRS